MPYHHGKQDLVCKVPLKLILVRELDSVSRDFRVGISLSSNLQTHLSNQTVFILCMDS